MKIHDISVPLSPALHVYPGDPGVEIFRPMTLAGGDVANLSYLRLGSHTGTHVDAPEHFIEGATTVDNIALNLLIGRARVLEITAPVITASVLQEFDLGPDVRLLFKTRNSYLWSEPEFVADFVHLTRDAASHLVENGIKLVGIDYLSVEKFGFDTPEVHRTLLSNGVVILEGIDLREVEPGDYELICLPLKIAGGDGAPARVVLRG
jgi:arylformamidase